MTQVEIFLKDLAREGAITSKFLAIVPNEKFDWKPHPKSMTIRQLTTHLAELPSWVSMVLHTTELDFAKGDYSPTPINDTAGLLETHAKGLADSLRDLAAAKESELAVTWTLRNGETILSTDSRADVIRMSISQTIHHRAQLGVFLRLLDIPIPGSYGPSADDPGAF